MSSVTSAMGELSRMRFRLNRGTTHRRCDVGDALFGIGTGRLWFIWARLRVQAPDFLALLFRAFDGLMIMNSKNKTLIKSKQLDLLCDVLQAFFVVL